MSLLDDVSIVVTPNGYKAGELYAVVPVPTEGAEEIDDGSFANDLDDWSKYGVTSATGGIATIGASANSGIYQTILTQGVRYTVTINVVSVNATGTSEVTNGNGNNLYTITETGIQTFIFTSAIASGQIILRGMSNALFSVSSVSVKEYTSADMDVTRATAATRVDENGLVNYAEVIGSELVADGSFPTGTSEWGTGTGVTVGGGVATFTSTPSGQSIQQNAVATDLPNGSLAKVSFEVLSRTEGSFGLYFSGTLVGSRSSVGVFTAYFTKGTQTSFYIRALGTTSGTISNVSVIEEVRDNVPRIDYTGGGCPHILAEPQRTNLITYSEDFSNAIWTKSGSSVTPNATTSPDGTINADKLVEDTSTGGHQIQSITSATNSTIYTTSVFVKYAGREWIRFTDAQSSNRIHFNTLTGVFGTISGTVIDYNKTALENGWYKLSFTTTSVATAYTPRIALAEADNDVSYTGDGVSGVYIYGCSLELGSYATSYIPTSGSTVTRNRDIFTRDGIGSLINSTEGVLFIEAVLLIDDDLAKCIVLSDGSSDNRVRIDFGYSSSRMQYTIYSSGALQCNIKIPYIGDSMDKIAVKWKQDDFAVWINGVEVGTDSSGLAPIGLNTIEFNSATFSSFFYGKVKQLQVYDTALTDTQLAALTS